MIWAISLYLSPPTKWSTMHVLCSWVTFRRVSSIAILSSTSSAKGFVPGGSDFSRSTNGIKDNSRRRRWYCRALFVAMR